MNKMLMILMFISFSFPVSLTVMAQDNNNQPRENGYDYYQRLMKENEEKRQREDDSFNDSYSNSYENPYDVSGESQDDRYKKLPKGKSNDFSYERAKSNKSSEQVLQDMMSTY